MIKGVFIVIVLLLSVSGLCDIIHTLRIWLFSSKRPRNNICVIYLKAEKAVSQLKFIREQYRWCGTDFAEYIIAVTDDLNQENIDALRDMFEDSGFIFCPLSAVPNVLRSLSKGNQDVRFLFR